MLKMRLVWRRTSSSQADPSPWRHCWTSWASCSNVSSASNPGTVTCAATPGQFLVKTVGRHLGLPYYGTKSAPKMFPWAPNSWPQPNGRILLIRRQKHNDLHALNDAERGYPKPASAIFASRY